MCLYVHICLFNPICFERYVSLHLARRVSRTKHCYYHQLTMFVVICDVVLPIVQKHACEANWELYIVNRCVRECAWLF